MIQPAAEIFDRYGETPDPGSERRGTPGRADRCAGVAGHGRSLRSKLVLSLAVMFIAFIAVDEMVRRNYLKPALLSLERAGGYRDVRRVIAAIESESNHLSSIADYLNTTHPAVAMHDRARPFGDSENDGIDFAGYVQTDGTWVPLHQDADTSTESIQGFAKLAVRHLPKMQSENSSSQFHAIQSADGQLALVALRAARHRPEDFLIVGRALDATSIRRLGRRTQVDFQLRQCVSGKPLQSTDPLSSPTTLAESGSVQTVIARFPVLADSGPEDLELMVFIPPDLARRALQAVYSGRNQFVFGSVAALLVLLLMLQRIVITPLQAIRFHAERVADEGLRAEPPEIKSRDEIGNLALSFHRMMRRLRQAQTRLSATSRAAGMSQVAGTVVHNIGNVLTNVNSLLEAASHKATQLRLAPLKGLATKLQESKDNDDLIREMPSYLRSLSETLESDRQELTEILQTLRCNLGHIEDVVRQQSRHAGTTTDHQTFCVGELIDEAVSCCQGRFDAADISVDVVGYPDVVVRSDRSILLQVLINVLTNSHAAFMDVKDRSRRIEIGVDEHGDEVCLWVRDNGCGIDSDVIDKLFDAHFTTREDGTGLGLHFCSLSMSGLNGRIEARSDGLGHGTTIVMSVPTGLISGLDTEAATKGEMLMEVGA
ncbi:ATP-binding protein [Crateriforma conspicua]|uniref:histidine kinase n=1 Tax=Crateriforma conspicua TaxID=2527996 RepID=A0A5C5YA44_9PLAN|nr:ATP-binding protein [Crateriforma conspicua]TWT72250.1 Phytochrome-like protein cph1 [Crateriforma conspicua]